MVIYDVDTSSIFGRCLCYTKIKITRIRMALTENGFWSGVGCCYGNITLCRCSVSFWCMFGVSVEVLMENILCWFIEVQTHIGMPRCAK